jgi:hypothetical protein
VRNKIAFVELLFGSDLFFRYWAFDNTNGVIIAAKAIDLPGDA